MTDIIIAGLTTGLAVGFGVLLIVAPFSALHRATNSV